MPVRDSMLELEPVGLRFRVQGVEWHYQAKGYMVLHSRLERSVRKSLLPGPSLSSFCFRSRCASGLVRGPSGSASGGAARQDTTGLLLLSDDGQFIHRISSPTVCLRCTGDGQHPVHSAHGGAFVCGVLDDDPRPVRAAACALVSDCVLDLTLTEGKYHQVKRMLAAVGNRVEALHRWKIGDLVLPRICPLGNGVG